MTGPHFHVINAMPGYLPDDDEPYCYPTLTSARADLAARAADLRDEMTWHMYHTNRRTDRDHDAVPTAYTFADSPTCARCHAPTFERMEPLYRVTGSARAGAYWYVPRDASPHHLGRDLYISGPCTEPDCEADE